MGENRHRHTVWMDDAVWDQVESHYQKDNCSTKNEYIEKAIQFYSGYLNSERAGDYLPRVLAATKLLHHLGQIFQDNSVPPAAPAGHGVDRKLLRKIRAKKIVMGHKPGDHEDLELTQGGMGGMTGY